MTKRNQACKALPPGLSIGPRIKMPHCLGCNQLIYLMADAVHNCPGGVDITEVKRARGWKASRQIK